MRVLRRRLLYIGAAHYARLRSSMRLFCVAPWLGIGDSTFQKCRSKGVDFWFEMQMFTKAVIYLGRSCFTERFHGAHIKESMFNWVWGGRGSPFFDLEIVDCKKSPPGMFPRLEHRGLSPSCVSNFPGCAQRVSGNLQAPPANNLRIAPRGARRRE